jgi:hypothetical protein
MDELREKTQHVVMNDSFTNKTWRCFDMYKNLIYHEQDGDSFDPDSITEKLEVIRKFYYDNQELCADDLDVAEPILIDRLKKARREYLDDLFMLDLFEAIYGKLRREIIVNERMRRGKI